MNTERSLGAASGPATSGTPRRSGLAAVFVLALALLTAVAAITPAAAAARREGGIVTVSFVNNSDRDLIGLSVTVPHGCVTPFVPGRIDAGTTGQWTAAACDDPAGTEGTVVYQIAGESAATTVRVGWNVPIVAPNTYTEAASTGYVVSHSGGDGAGAAVRFTFDCNSTTCDGIPDDWKRNGVTITPGDGSPAKFIDLPKMGADVNKPDIFVQLDWMADTTHSHALDPAAIRRVVDAFANSPFNRHSPTTGINLHVDAGPNSILNFATNTTWGDLSRAKSQTEVANLGTADANKMYQWTAFNALKAATGGFVSTGRSSIFHYAVSAHNLEAGSTSSGISAGAPASDFIVSLGSFANSVGTVNQQAGTFMHELGHNLGLLHGGNASTPNHKPQYFSVMNYSYQMGLTSGTTGGLMDFARQQVPLNENTLNERQYPPTSKGYDVSHYCPNRTGGGAFVTVPSSTGQVDWDCDGTISQVPVAFDTNNDNAITTLGGFDDWSALQLRGGSISHPGSPAGVPAPTKDDELSMEEAMMDLPVDTTAPVTEATTHPHASKHGVFREDVTVTLTATDDLSGVARTEYDLDGAGWTEYTGPVRVSGDGEHTLLYRSIDLAQNHEEDRSLVLRIECEEEGWHRTS
ncbi:OmpL47-type beta-barrel domain-containing protein [Kitasatospora sp. NPDC057015]|uniref:OmpL47-type beta-barrel domain-containing protein n=1 Tax=Kitasatospora sp. NPDC057015 TaxID=3346001 RepID=UPI0036344208